MTTTAPPASRQAQRAYKTADAYRQALIEALNDADAEPALFRVLLSAFIRADSHYQTVAKATAPGEAA